jgi:hypothetical protein
MAYSALFNIVIEALNLIFKKILAEIQLPVNITHLLSIPQSSMKSSDMACHPRFPSHHMTYLPHEWKYEKKGGGGFPSRKYSILVLYHRSLHSNPAPEKIEIQIG